MAENTQSNQGSAATASTSGASKSIQVDKNKTEAQYIKDAEAFYIIPALIRKKFPDLVKLIFETESMDEEEREYWLQIMPIMSEEQIVKFRDILVNEKEQLAKLDKEYENEMSRINKPVKDIDEKAMKEKIAAIHEVEKASKQQDTTEEQVLLDKLNNI